jgi:hypothetical protein
MRFRITAVVFLGVAACCAQAPADVPPEILVLARTRQKVNERLAKLSDYTCLQTTERWTRQPKAKEFRRSDTLVLEVAQIGKKELYSWPGGRSFDSSAPEDFVSSGTVSSGAFALFLRAAFSGGATIAFAGEGQWNGRRAFKYDYAVPIYLSRIMIGIQGAEGEAASKGSFWTDPETHDVLRLEVHAVDIPPNVPASALVTAIDYARMRIGSDFVWLPQSVDQLLTFVSGRQDRNLTEFSHCRAYSSQATLRFGEEDAGPAAAAPAPVKEIRLPEGVALALELETEVDSESAAIGDPLRAAVREDVKVGGEILIPKGAMASGRLRLLIRDSSPTPHFIVGLEFTELEFPGHRAMLYARLDRPPDVRGLREYISSTGPERVENAPGYRRYTSATEQVRIVQIPGVSTVLIEGRTFRLPKGLRMVWRTERLR